MGTPHKHKDVIISWANGEEIEQRWYGADQWQSCVCNPAWEEACEYRIKPKRVKKEGWVNVYPATLDRHCASLSNAFATQIEADKSERGGRVACIRIEWEEEE